MRISVLLCVAALLAVPALSETTTHTGPSGLTYAAQEPLFEPTGAYEAARRMVRLRFVAPELANQEAYGFDVIEADFQALCDSQGTKTVANFAPNARQIVVSVASEEVAFGESAPNVTQYFDLFRVEDGTCIWEGI